MFVVGLVLFSVASLVCGLSGSAALLVAARAAQGFGAAVVTPAALSILTGAFPERGGRSRAVGFWTAAQAGGGASGWILGGFLAQGPGWEWVFLSTMPVGVLGVLLAPLLLRESSDPSAPPKLDAAGATTVTAALALLVYGLTRAEETGLTSPSTLGSLGLSVTLVAVFISIEARVKHPLVPLGVFRSRDLVGSGLVALAFQATTSAPLLLCILYLQEVAGSPPAEAGFAFVPFNLAVVTGSFFGSRLTGGIGARITATSGLSAIAVGVLLLTKITPVGGYPGVLPPGFVLIGLGVELSAVASTTAGTDLGRGRREAGLGLGASERLRRGRLRTGPGLARPPRRCPDRLLGWGLGASAGRRPCRRVQVGVLRWRGAGRARRADGPGADPRHSGRRRWTQQPLVIAFFLPWTAPARRPRVGEQGNGGHPPRAVISGRTERGHKEPLLLQHGRHPRSRRCSRG